MRSSIEVAASKRLNGRPPSVTAAMRLPRGSRRRSVSLRARSGTSTFARTAVLDACSEYESDRKLVGASATAIRLPAASHARGVEYASWRPFGVSCTSISRSVSRKAALLAPFGGRYIAR